MRQFLKNACRSKNGSELLSSVLDVLLCTPNRGHAVLLTPFSIESDATKPYP